LIHNVPKRETIKDPLWTGYFIMPQKGKLNDLHGRAMVNIVSGETFHICDKNSSRLPKPPGWLSLRTAGEFRFIGKEASTRWAGGVDLSMLPAAGALDPADETCREYKRVVDEKYLDEIRAQAKQFSTRSLSRQSAIAKCAIINFKGGKNTIKPRTLQRLIKAIHVLQGSRPGSW
jgi:hypothetical protein